MARRTEYDASQAAKRLKVPAAAFRWARHARLISAPDVSSWQWSRAAVEAMDADAIRAALSCDPISGGAAADRIAEALGTPNVVGERAQVTSFVVRRFIGRGLLTELFGIAPETAMKYVKAAHPHHFTKDPTRA